MKKLISIILIIVTILGCSISLSGCGSSRSSKDHDWGYYDRSDGKRIWYKTK